MRAVLRWLPGVLCAVIWVLLTGIVQPLFSQIGVLLYTDAALLLVPARFFPHGPAIAIVATGTLCADAFREGPFGLSATFLLPLLLVLVAFRSSLRLRPDGWWLTITAALNTLVFAACTTIWTLMQSARHNSQPLPWQDATFGDAFVGILSGAVVSSAVVVLVGPWFSSLQLSLFALLGRDLRRENQ